MLLCPYLEKFCAHMYCHNIIQMEDCVVGDGLVFGVKAIVVFFLGVFLFVLLVLSTIGLTWAFECIRAVIVVIREPGMEPYVLSSGVNCKCLGKGSSSSDVELLSGKAGYRFDCFSAMGRTK